MILIQTIGRKFDIGFTLKPLHKMEKVLFLMAVTFLSFEQWLDQYIWHPWWTIYVLLLSMLADLLSGISLSIKRGEHFSTRKFTVWISTMFGFLFMLGVGYNFPRVNDVLGWPALSPLLTGIVRLLYLLMLTNTIISAGKNLTLVGAISGKVGEFFIKYIDTYKNRVEDIMVKQVKQIDPPE